MNLLMLRTDALAKGFILYLQGGVRIPVLSGIGLELRAGECVVLSGPSGVGKSTLMRSLYGNYRAESGHILIRHRGEMVDLVTADPRTILAIRHETLGYVSQFLRVVPRVPAVDVVAEVLIGRGSTQDEARRIATDLLLRLNIPRRLHGLPPATFSGGMLQRLQIARTLVTHPRLVFMDEPTGSLDVSVQARLLDLIRSLVTRLNIAVVLVTHDIGVARLLAHRIIVMQRGRVVETGLTDQVLDDPQHPYTQLLVSSVLHA